MNTQKQALTIIVVIMVVGFLYGFVKFMYAREVAKKGTSERVDCLKRAEKRFDDFFIYVPNQDASLEIKEEYRKVNDYLNFLAGYEIKRCETVHPLKIE